MQEQTYWTYIITNAFQGTLYIGQTHDIYRRMEEHINGDVAGFSKRYGLKHLVWQHMFETRDEAFKKERQLKEWKRDWKIELIEKENPMWIDIHTVPVWPLPDKALFSDLYADCLKHRLDPGVRRDERRYF